MSAYRRRAATWWTGCWCRTQSPRAQREPHAALVLQRMHASVVNQTNAWHMFTRRDRTTRNGIQGSSCNEANRYCKLHQLHICWALEWEKIGVGMMVMQDHEPHPVAPPPMMSTSKVVDFRSFTLSHDENSNSDTHKLEQFHAEMQRKSHHFLARRQRSLSQSNSRLRTRSHLVQLIQLSSRQTSSNHRPQRYHAHPLGQTAPHADPINLRTE
jgi:hypothetical protein